MPFAFMHSREKRNETRGKGAFGEEASEEIGNAEGDDERGGCVTSAEQGRLQHVADEAGDARAERVKADRADTLEKRRRRHLYP